MNHHVNAIAGRLSLRTPQRESLEILSEVCGALPLEKDQDAAECLRAVSGLFPSVTDFEREFPSLCFALATGVGKTRLMGAFISYLYRVENIRHFFVLAPNLTIYNKLIADFTPNTPKYVFKGIAEFTTMPPVVITGDTYEQGIGVRELGGQSQFFDQAEAHINIFNISKINSEVRGGSSPRIKRLSEYIGESYFEYLASLPDLVLLMDESHRYRASAGVRAINELRPVLGLELTATPFIQQGRNRSDFKNIVYSYPLANALTDGYVKEPAVGTRENFERANYGAEALDRLKLEDGVRFHANTKTELEMYARDNNQPMVKPFMLVVAQDTAHANELLRIIEDDSFFDGRYRDKVITVHSNQRGEEKDETIQQLLTVEDPGNPIEIVIHVNMLKEGWDVTNLFTIVPLRAANAMQLVEQTVGRGLRLPYGKRTGNPAVDRLTIVSHDKFQEIIDRANDPNSIIRSGVVIGREVPDEPSRIVVVRPEVERRLFGDDRAGQGEQTHLYTRPADREVARAALQVLSEYEHLPRSEALNAPDIQAEIVAKVDAKIGSSQYEIEGTAEMVGVPRVVRETTERFIAETIDIPHICVEPKGESRAGFADFDLDTGNVRLQPVPSSLMSQGLHQGERFRLVGGDGIIEVERPEDVLVQGLAEFDDVNYDADARLLYKLAGQMVDHLRSYLNGDDEVLNVLQYHKHQLVNLIHAQMRANYQDATEAFEVKVTSGFHVLRPLSLKLAENEQVRDFRLPVEDKSRIRRMCFGGFRRCLYAEQRFDADPERRLAVVLENDVEVLKWCRLSKNDIVIVYDREGTPYIPDFVVEAKTGKYLCECKADNEMEDEIVRAKARAAVEWCEHATAHARSHGDKNWQYLLIPETAIRENMTLGGLAAAYRVHSDA